MTTQGPLAPPGPAVILDSLEPRLRQPEMTTAIASRFPSHSYQRQFKMASPSEYMSTDDFARTLDENAR